MVRSRGSSLIIAARLLLLLLAAGAVVSAFLLARGHDRTNSSAQGRYVCPMHPEVTSAIPAQCPICSMALERVDRAPAAAAASYSLPELDRLPNHTLVTANPERRVFAQEMRVPAWVEATGLVGALLYNDEMTDLSPGDRALFFRAVTPAVGYDVRLAADPPAAWDRSTSRVRFHTSAAALRPGEVGWLTLPARSRDVLVIPLTAVVNSPRGPYVLVASADGNTFTKRPVQIGRTVRGFVVVVGGVREQDRVVVGNTFFLDAERRLQPEGGEAVGVQR